MDTEDQNTKTSPKPKTKGIGIALLVLGALCILAAFGAFGDIGISFGAAGVASILAGIGFIKNSSKSNTKGIGIALLVLGVLCIPAAFVALEKIGFSFGATGIASILAGIGFIKNKNTEDQNTETSSKSKTKGIGIALLVLGVLCFLASIAFENAAGTISILAGIGFIKNKKTEAQNTKTSSKSKTKVIGVALLVLGALCVSAAFVAYGDIGLSFGATGIAAIIAGIGFIKNKNTEDQNAETSSKSKTKGFGIALLVLGALCILSFVAFGNISLSFGTTGIASILAGIGFIKNSSKPKTKGFGIALLVLGVLCIPAAFVALGDLGLSFGATVIASILAGIGFIKNK